MSRKNLIMGIGIGIVCCGVLLMFTAGRMQTKELSDAEIKKRAEQLGMVEEDKPILSSDRTQQEEPMLVNNNTADDPVSGDGTDKKTDTVKDDNDDGGKGKDLTSDKSSEQESSDLKQSQQSKSTENKQSTKKKPAGEDGKVETVTVNITKGMSASQICTELENAGVVESAKDLEEFIQSKKSTNRLLAGTFELKKNAEFDEILGVIMH